MGIIIRQATPEDDEGILELIRRSPQPGSMMTLNFERDPSFFHGAHVTCEHPEVWVAHKKEEPSRIIGALNMGWRRIYVNGEIRKIRYGNDLRIDPDHRGGTLLIRLYKQVRATFAENEWAQTIILSENQASIDALCSGRAGMPTYYPQGHIETSLITAAPKKAPSQGLTISRASEEDLPAMQAFLDEQAPKRQFYPVYQLSDMLSGSDYYRGISIEDYWLAWRDGQIEGMVGTWNQKSFKQTRVVRYSVPMELLRHVYNLYGALMGAIRLPGAGGILDYRQLHTMLIRDDNPDTLAALIRPAIRLAREERAALVCAFFEEDPLRQAMHGLRRRTLASSHFVGCYERDPRSEFDNRTPYIEVSRL